MSENVACLICEDERMSFSWTDAHGVAQCFRCGTPYRIIHYENERRVEKPPTITLKPQYIPAVRDYWNEFHRRIPSGHSIPGGQELASHADAEQFYGWMKENAEKYDAALRPADAAGMPATPNKGTPQL